VVQRHWDSSEDLHYVDKNQSLEVIRGFFISSKLIENNLFLYVTNHHF
jgi:hypothetical protein